MRNSISNERAFAKHIDRAALCIRTLLIGTGCAGLPAARAFEAVRVALGICPNTGQAARATKIASPRYSRNIAALALIAAALGPALTTVITLRGISAAKSLLVKSAKVPGIEHLRSRYSQH